MFLTEEIASQPATWGLARDMSAAGLPEPGKRVAMLGCGTSYYMAQSYAALREAAGQARPTRGRRRNSRPPGDTTGWSPSR